MTAKLEIDRILIKEVKKFTFLYDPNDMNHKRLEKRKEAWDEIGKVLRKDGIDCMNRWKLLRDRYRKEKRLILKKLKEKSHLTKKKWVYYDMMSFLDPCLEEVKPITENDELLIHNIKREPIEEDTSVDGYEGQFDVDNSEPVFHNLGRNTSLTGDNEELLSNPQGLETSINEPMAHQNSVSSQEDSNSSQNFHQNLVPPLQIIVSPKELQNLQHTSQNSENEYEEILPETKQSSCPNIVHCIKKEPVEEEAVVDDYKAQDNHDNLANSYIFQNAHADTSVTGDCKELFDQPQESESTTDGTITYLDSQSSSQEDSNDSQNFHQNYKPLQSLKTIVNELRDSQYAPQHFQRQYTVILPDIAQSSSSVVVNDMKLELVEEERVVNSCNDQDRNFQPPHEGTSNSQNIHQSFAPLSMIGIVVPPTNELLNSPYACRNSTKKYVTILPKTAQPTSSTYGIILKPLEETTVIDDKSLASHDSIDKSDDSARLVVEDKTPNVTHWGSYMKKVKRITKGKCVMDDTDIIVQLKASSFGSRKFEDKLSIIRNGRPCPTLKNMTTVVKEKTKSYTRHFTVSNYESHNWLCGSHSLQKLFCWPCLLFSKSSSNVWVSSGFSNLSGLSKSAKAHENSENHLQCVMHLYNFGKHRVEKALDKTFKVSNSLHNQKVKKNREILKRLIDVTCFLTKQELPFHGYDGDTPLNKGNYMETLHLLTKWDPLLAEHFETATIFNETLHDIQNNLIHTINEVVNETVLQEIRETEFVSIMLDETSDIKSRSQLSTVLRYIHKGENCIKERFIRFNDVSADRTTDGLFSHVKSIIEEYKLTDKLVAQTYDGASVMPGHLSNLQKKVVDEYPKALYTPCYAHILNSVLVQGMSEIPECNIFFSTLNGVATYPSHSSKGSFAVQEYLKKCIPSFAPTRWSFTSLLVNTVETYLEPITDFFASIYENDDDKWNGSNRCAAQGYVDFLTKFETVFLLNLFSLLFSQTDVLFQTLQMENMDIMECVNGVKDLHKFLRKFRQGVDHCDECQKKVSDKIISEKDKCDKCIIVGFQPLWEKTVSMMDLPVASKKRRCNESDDLSQEQFYHRLYFSIIDNLISHLTTRFASLQNLAFFELLNPRKFQKFSQKNNFPDSLLNDLVQIYPNIFDLCGLTNELTVFYRSSTFHGKSLHSLIKFLKNENLDQPFREVFRLAKLISTIPTMAASVEQNFSALKRIRNYKRSKQGEDQMNCLSLLSIEKEMLSSLKEKEGFYDTVISKFAARTRRFDYIYK